VSNETAFLPTYGDAKVAVENMVGTEFYKPKTMAGEYARTVGEFAPMAAAGPGGWVARGANVVAPAIASETAGQLTKGTEWEPYARVAGAFVGPRLATPLPVDRVRQGHIERLRNEGVTDLTAGQLTGSKPLQWMESVTRDTPLAGRRATRMMERQDAQFTRAALRRIGVEADRATPEVIDGAFTRIGQQFDDLAASTTVRADRQLSDDLANAIADYQALVPDAMQARIIQEGAGSIMQAARQPGGLSGAQYQAFRSRLDRLGRQSVADPQLSGALRSMRDALDDAMGRNMPDEAAHAWQQTRTQYRYLLAVEKALGGAGEKTANGYISPAQLRTAMKTQNKRSFSRGQDDMGELARAGVSTMSPLPQSGTAPRLNARGVISGMGAGVGAAAGGAPGAIVGAVLPAMAEAAFGRALMSRPVQGYLANQLAAGGGELPALLTNALLSPQLLAEHGGLVGRQTRGAYPPGDPRWREENQ
jgi:hypothetical protein